MVPSLQRDSRAVFLLHCILLLLLFSGVRGDGQITFLSTDWLTTTGSYYRAYVSSDVSAPFVGTATNTPQRWDFSQPKQDGEFLRRMDIVPISDGGHGDRFPNATYAERFIDDVYSIWDYYHINPSLNRTYHGFFNGGLLGASSITPPALDVPDAVSFGSNWNSTYVLEGEFFLTRQTINAVIDAYGMLVLPHLGEVPALRVNQLTFQYMYLNNGTPLGSDYFREYYWLARGVGKAMHIVSEHSPTPPPLSFANAASVRRVFEVRPWRVADLQIKRQGTAAVLYWTQETNTSGYRVETIGTVISTNWQVLGEPNSNTWSTSLSATQAQRFFRVITKP